MDQINSMLPEIAWPAVPNPRAAGLLAMLYQLDQSQWLAPEEILRRQLAQLKHVVEHARATVPYYRERLDGIGSLDDLGQWSRLPLLSRRDIQHAGSALHSARIPDGHGGSRTARTGGSTNQPVETLATSLTDFFWEVLTLRDHAWHQRDLNQSLAAIRYTGDDTAQPPEGLTARQWSPAMTGLCETGSAHLLNIRCDLAEQVSWLTRINPGYVLSYPSTVRAMAESYASDLARLTNLRELRTFGEILEPDCRAICERAFGVKVVDMYSSQEVGYIALQCPEGHGYHVQAESVLVEVLDETGNPCLPGQVGKVIVSSLHNFAMPLLRYDLGDYAEVGEPCACGRGLPVLKRILGRQRNLLVMPDGRRCWPVFDAGERPEELPPFYQFQVIQRAVDHLEVLVVRHADMTADEEQVVARFLRQSLGYPFKIAIRRVDSIPRSPAGKFEDFVSRIE